MILILKGLLSLEYINLMEKIYEWAYAKYGYTPLEFRKACCEGRLSAHEYYIEAGFFDDDELRKMGRAPKAS
jgi:hypothetical protein